MDTNEQASKLTANDEIIEAIDTKHGAQTIVFHLPGTEEETHANDGQTSSTSTHTSKSEHKGAKKPTCIIILGMAGSGKTTLVQRLVSYLSSKNKDKRKMPYVVNLDPACMEVSSA